MSMPMPSATASRTGKITGTLVSRDETSIQVKAKQKEAAETFIIDKRTKSKGELQPGNEVTVKYQEQAGLRKAMSIEAKRAKAKHSHEVCLGLSRLK